MAILQVEDSTKTLEYGRGDSFGSEFTLTQKDKTPIDITGFSFRMTVNSDLDPTDTLDELFTVVGIITDPTGGKVEFSPTAVDTDLDPETYFYDIEMTDVASKIRTVIKASFVITQDISK